MCNPISFIVTKKAIHHCHPELFGESEEFMGIAVLGIKVDSDADSHSTIARAHDLNGGDALCCETSYGNAGPGLVLELPTVNDVSLAGLALLWFQSKDMRNLRNADLWNANLRYANLRNADLWNADLRHADLRNANLSDANLRNANLSYANLSDADMSDANLRKARWNEFTRWPNGFTPPESDSE